MTKTTNTETPADHVEVIVATPADDNPSPKEFRYSKGMKKAQKAERKASKAMRRVADAVEEGISSYLKKRDKSAAKKKDGALEDVFLNVSRGLADFAESASPAIYDFGTAANTMKMSKKQRKSIKKQIRRFNKSFPNPFRFK